MASTYTTNKDLEKPANGDYVDTWNIPVNGNMNYIDQAFGGVTNLNGTSGSATLTDTQYRSLMIYITGALSANITYTIPSGIGGQWIVNNSTTGNYTVTFASGGGGTTQETLQGSVTPIASNGTDIWIIRSPDLLPTGGGNNKAFFLNDTTITNNYTVPTNQNAGTFGPVTVNSGVTVTVGSGSYWSIV